MQINAVIFDLDGTLIDSNHDYAEMRRRTLDVLLKNGVPEIEMINAGRIWEIKKFSREYLIEKGILEEEWENIENKINETLNSIELKALKNAKSMQDAQKTLNIIKARDMKIGVATRSHRVYAEAVLKKTRLRMYIDSLLARDDTKHPKPDPRHLFQIVKALNTTPKKTIFVGDTNTDQITAQYAGIRFIGIPRNKTYEKRMKKNSYGNLVGELTQILDFI
jgi:phosphoglycolate phosphatase